MANAQKTAIVTGASQGIGAGLVDAFLKRDYNVVANSRNIAKTNPFPASPNLALVGGDIGDPKTAAKIVETAVSRFGRIDALINNAGVFIPKPFTEYTAEFEAAGELGITEYTVQVHRGHIMKKLHTKSFAALVKLASKLPTDLASCQKQ